MTRKKKIADGSILKITSYERYRTVEELFEKSQANSSYYTLLALSILIIAAGLLLNNIPIVIGGMLVAPVLTPLLLISLSVSLGELSIIRRVGLLMYKSFGIILVVSFFLALLFGHTQATFEIENTARTALLYFIVAIASGVAGTFAMTRKELSDVLPGVAVAISLVPPLALVGIWLSDLNFAFAQFYFLIFLFNLFGILVGGLAVFSLLGFYRLKTTVEAQEKAEIKKEKDAKAARMEA